MLSEGGGVYTGTGPARKDNPCRARLEMGAPLYRSFAAAAFSIAAATGASAAAPGFFDSSVAPILKENCVVCHGGSDPQAELDLRTEASILKGGKSGPGVVLGSAERSLVISKVVSGIMPPGDAELSRQQIDTPPGMDRPSQREKGSTGHREGRSPGFPDALRYLSRHAPPRGRP